MMMMRYYIKTVQLVAIIVILTLCQSCNNDSLEEIPSVVVIKSCSIDCTILSESGSRTIDQYQWTEGDKLFVEFEERNSYSHKGIATFKHGEWSLELEETSNTLPIISNAQCNVYYIKGAFSLNESEVTFTSDSCPFKTYEGCYSVTADGYVSISATLSPIFLRFRLKGEKNTTYEIKGVYWMPNKYDVWSLGYGMFENMESKTVACTIQEKDAYYSPYLYCHQSGAPFKIKIGTKVFARGDSPFEEGKSYVISVPTESNHENWVMEDYVKERFSISRTPIGVEDSFNYSHEELVDIKATLASKIGVSANGYISCIASDASKRAATYITCGDEHPAIDLWSNLFGRCLFDTSNYGYTYEPHFEAWISTVSIGDYYNATEYHLYLSGYNSYVEGGSYIDLSNF